MRVGRQRMKTTEPELENYQNIEVPKNIIMENYILQNNKYLK